MHKLDVQIALEKVHAARTAWDAANRKFSADVEYIMRRMIHESVVNFLSAEEVARLSGFTVKRVRILMRSAGLDPKSGKRLLSKQAAEALSSNAELMGINPNEMDLMSPLAYLPMGDAMKRELQAKTVSQVDTPCDCENQPPHLKRCHCATPQSSGSLNHGAEICLHCSYRIGHEG